MAPGEAGGGDVEGGDGGDGGGDGDDAHASGSSATRSSHAPRYDPVRHRTSPPPRVAPPHRGPSEARRPHPLAQQHAARSEQEEGGPKLTALLGAARRGRGVPAHEGKGGGKVDGVSRRARGRLVGRVVLVGERPVVRLFVRRRGGAAGPVAQRGQWQRGRQRRWRSRRRRQRARQAHPYPYPVVSSPPLAVLVAQCVAERTAPRRSLLVGRALEGGRRPCDAVVVAAGGATLAGRAGAALHRDGCPVVRSGSSVAATCLHVGVAVEDQDPSRGGELNDCRRGSPPLRARLAR